MCCVTQLTGPQNELIFFWFCDLERSFFVLFVKIERAISSMCINQQQLLYSVCVWVYMTSMQENRQAISRKRVKWLGSMWICCNQLTIYNSHKCASCKRVRARHTGAETLALALSLYLYHYFILHTCLCVCSSVALHKIWVKHLWNKNTYTKIEKST